MYHGLIAIWKEEGYTSHDVVSKMRGILHQKKIGHTGTLDPQATGVLAVGLGLGTKTLDLLPDKRKKYEAEITFGVETDTEDIWGTVLSSDSNFPETDAAEAAIMSFKGEYMQTPPMYSAKKVNGRKLYELAREGKTIERMPVRVIIYDIRVLEKSAEKIRFEVECSAGTYIRTLCCDIGRKLGCKACMSSLKRISACGFSAENCVTLEQLRCLQDENRTEEAIISIDSALNIYPKITVKPEYEKALKNGNQFTSDAVGYKEAGKQGLFRVWLDNSGLMGIYSNSKDRDIYIPVKIFYRSEELQ